ncbi:hypothetical protein OY671_002399 [Metschnikowia pulcherrima]|nr:hypothetical protein OY671_002399 [Metschnikowia pulcherrima]
MITASSIPESLKSDRNVAPFIARSVELAEVNPVVSYYCKLYVLEHILTEKLHQSNKDVEGFTIALLDDTEALKASPDDESVHRVLASRQLSIDFVFVFAFKLYNSCLEDLSNYDGTKPRLAQKLRATINFWSLFPLFAGDSGDPIDYAKTSGDQADSEDSFLAFTREKLKTLKYQLSRLLKDEVPVKGEEKEFEEFADKSVENGEDLEDCDTNAGDFNENGAAGIEGRSEGDSAANTRPEHEKSDDIDSDNDMDSQSGFTLPEPPQTNPQIDLDEENDGNSGFTLPGAPKFDPSKNTDPADSDIHLPGAPKLLPDDDLTTVNKNSSIKVFQPKNGENTKSTPVRPQSSSQRSASSNVVHVTKDTLHTIVDTTEQIGKIQKHAKFAISALNYEDLGTAEAELIKGLELLRSIKEKS